MPSFHLCQQEEQAKASNSQPISHPKQDISKNNSIAYLQSRKTTKRHPLNPLTINLSKTMIISQISPNKNRNKNRSRSRSRSKNNNRKKPLQNNSINRAAID